MSKMAENAMDKVVFRRQVSEFSGQSQPMPDNNLLRLKRISQSFDDLTSETLYSKWKKARKNAAKSDLRDRSVSMGSFNEEEPNINKNGVAYSLAATLQRQVLRPRGWTVCNGELSRDKEKGVLNTSNFPKDKLSESLSTNEGSKVATANSWKNLGDEVFSVPTSKPGSKESIESTKSRIIEEIISSAPRKIRSLSDSEQAISEQSSVRRGLIRDANATGRRSSETRVRSLSCREPREIEFHRNREMAQRYVEHYKTPREDIWQKRSSTGDIVAQGRHKRIPRPRSLNYARSEVNNNARNIQEASLGFQNDRSLPDANERYRPGCTYALIRQPEHGITHPNRYDNSIVNTNPTSQTTKVLHRTMSEPKKGLQSKESRSVEQKEMQERIVKFKEVEYSVSDHKTPREGHGVRRAQTLPRMPKRPPLSSLTSRSWKDSEMKTRKAAEDLISNMNNSDDKTAQERVDIVEKAFEWIRKEVADLRAQDKDIMRMFTKIQAGIRHIKFDQSSLMESEEEFISTPDLSSTHSPGEGAKVLRRASLL